MSDIDVTFMTGNTRVITQKALQTFQDEMGKVIKDPYKVNKQVVSFSQGLVFFIATSFISTLFISIE